MRTRALGATGVTTSTLGFGSASLFHQPQKRQRRRLLDAAFDAGVRHFDVAPIYGLGQAEPELAAFLEHRRNEVTVATKFGLLPTLVGRAAGLVQGPVRAALQRLPRAQAGLQSSAAGPESGGFGQLLYRSADHSRVSAEASLTRSLRALGTDHLELFLLHEPPRDLPAAPELVDYLEGERQRGRIRAWGTAGDVNPTQGDQLFTLPGLQVVQRRDDLVHEPGVLADGLGLVTFGVLARTLGPLRQLLSAQPTRLRTWNEMVGEDLSRGDALVSLLLREAVRRNPNGPVLFTTTRPERVQSAVTAVERDQSAEEALVVAELRAAVRPLVEGNAR